ncbi:hypothetical protein SAMN02746062_00790 [Alysiella filiformis DSM 16848]|uniref:Uncharacterized protein n=1 Tax=Alysiella filiformis DSM 16848 TaxID=1120981 RepID=A0A286E848_9NEIS|nr:hypothetical protein SAMN02746062_00790 [Alysiella filiformis DSM 16848]
MPFSGSLNLTSRTKNAIIHPNLSIQTAVFNAAEIILQRDKINALGG